MTPSTSWFNTLLGRMLGIDNLHGVNDYSFTFAQVWAKSSPAWVFIGCAALALLAFAFYSRTQRRARPAIRYSLAAARALVLGLLFLFLADPVLWLAYRSVPKPLLYVLVDGTESMAIEDDLSQQQRAQLSAAMGVDDLATLGAAEKQAPANTSGETARQRAGDDGGTGLPERVDGTPQRIELVRALLSKQEKNLLEELQQRFRLRAFVLEQPEGVRALKLGADDKGGLEPEFLAGQLSAEGDVTALGEALADLARRHSSSHLAGVVMLSDFGWNTGPAPLGEEHSPVKSLGVPLYCVGVGAEVAADLAVSITTPPMMKRAERDLILVNLRQQELGGRLVQVRLLARQITDEDGLSVDSEFEPVDREKTVELVGALTPVEFPYTPEETGRFEFAAQVEPLDGETIEENNRAASEVVIRDDFLRLMYVAHQPNWEWRFIKEVFHRDKLVGLRGFRTYLRSSDPLVRRSNPLFLPTLTPPRKDFFANDVIFLGDMPGNVLSDRFCEMTREFVSTFGGGLVVIAGPQFGLGEIARRPILADMLPVEVNPGAQIRAEREFRLTFTSEAGLYDFMQLGESEAETQQGWDNLGRLPWYQPVLRKHTLATVLAEHPTDLCVDGSTPQPLIAIRQYGKGKVVYIAFDETWRLRRKYGEKFYRRFWGQLIYHLGLRRDLGSQKRFVVRTDRRQYRSDDQVILTVDAYDENFEPLGEDQLSQRKLTAELIVPDPESDGTRAEPLSIPFTQDGLFETRIPVLEAGEHRVRVRDPITQQYSEAIFQVASVSVERQSAVRNVALQNELAQASGGRSYDLLTVDRLLDDIKVEPQEEVSIEVFPLMSTWLCFSLVALLLLGEWLVRKWVNLA